MAGTVGGAEDRDELVSDAHDGEVGPDGIVVFHASQSLIVGAGG